MPSAAYYRAWRLAHPEYRERQNELRNERRRRSGRGDRSREYARRKPRAAPPLPPLHTGHYLFDLARSIVGPRVSTLTTLYDPTHEDLLSEAVLALLEASSAPEGIAAAAKAARAFAQREYAWGRVTAPWLLGEE